MKKFLALFFIFGSIHAQSLPLGYLSPTSSPIPSDATSTVLHYTDGETDIQLSLAGLPANTPQDVYDLGTTPDSIATGTFGLSVIHGGKRVNGTALTGCAQYACAYLGAINIGPTAGQITTNVSFTGAPRWDVYNFFNQRNLELRAGGSATFNVRVAAGASPPTPAWQQFPAAFSALPFTGIPEDVSATFYQAINTLAPPGAGSAAAGSAWGQVAIGLNSLTPCGFTGEFGLDNGIIVSGGNGPGPGASVPASCTLRNYIGAVPIIGLYWARVISNSVNPAQTTFFGNNEGNAVISVKWKG